MINQKFGRLLVLERLENSKSGNIIYLCLCECGEKSRSSGSSLRLGRTQSCGCLRKERNLAACVKHGLYGTKIYKHWISMNHRCEGTNAVNYSVYKSRGIKVCDEWKSSFLKFYEDMNDSYVLHSKQFGASNTTLDRINNNFNYSPDNCRWVTIYQQCSNKRKTRFFEFENKVYTIKELSVVLGMKHSSVMHYINKGWTMDGKLKLII